MGPKLLNCCGRGRKSPSHRGKELENRWRKEKNYEKDAYEAAKQFWNGKINGAKRPVELGKRKNNEGKRGSAK